MTTQKELEKELNARDEALVLCAAEFGYKACEKGMNIQWTLAEVLKILRGER